MSLRDLLYTGYNDRGAQEKTLRDEGFEKVSSNHNSQTYYNPKTETLYKNINGTHNFGDWVNNAKYALTGDIKNDRYFQEKNDLEKSKGKLKPKKTILSGNSIGGAYVRAIASKEDKIITHNAPSHLFKDKPRSNEQAYRTRGDLVSILSANSKNTKTVPINYTPSTTPFSSYNLISNTLKSHKTSTLNKNIRVL